jgi:peptide deformylase
MTVLPIVISPDPRLKEISKPVEQITPEILSLLDDMLDTMYAARGIGLSAVQVGHMLRLVTIDIEQGEDGTPGNPIKMINPEVIATSEEENIYNEGCLSFPGHYSEVTRPKNATIRYTDIHGNQQLLEADELMATCVQHEIDHMNGIVFVDHISRLKREMIVRKIIKARKLEQFDPTIYDL